MRRLLLLPTPCTFHARELRVHTCVRAVCGQIYCMWHDTRALRTSEPTNEFTLVNDTAMKATYDVRRRRCTMDRGSVLCSPSLYRPRSTADLCMPLLRVTSDDTGRDREHTTCYTHPAIYKRQHAPCTPLNIYIFIIFHARFRTQ